MTQHHQQRFAAIALSIVLTLAMLASVNALATSQPPAGLLVQLATTAAHS